MVHIFVNPEQMQGDMLTITGSDVNHIRNVMRLKPGDEISVRNGADSREYRYGIEAYTDDAVICRLRFIKEADVELPVKVILFQGLPKADKMDLIVQKTVELGVTEIVPVAMKRCVMKLDDRRREKKIQRWQTIARSAAEQSRRAIVPQVREPMTMQEAVRYASENTDIRLVPYELQKDDGSTKETFARLEAGQSLSVFIGPEGGFEPDEIALARESGIRPISLGKRILRTETAAMVVLSWLIWKFEIN